MILYNPKLLREEKENVVKQFKDSVSLKYQSIDKVRELVQRVAKWDKDRTEKLAEMLTSQEVFLICGYVITNKYRVKCENLYTVIHLRADSIGMESLFRDWQNHYLSKEGQKHIGDFLEFNDVFRNLIKEKQLDLIKVQSWIRAKDIVNELLKKISPDYTIERYESELLKCGVWNDTLLMQECLARFYLFCSRKIYLQKGDSGLIPIFASYDREREKAFLVNLLKKLSLNDLRGFEKLHSSIRGTFPQGRDKEFEAELKAQGLFYKFEQWTNIMQIQTFFEDRERIDFWIQYISNNKIKIIKDDRLIIDFGDYVVTEFALNADGAAYIWDKKFFESVVRWKMNDSKQQLKRFMYHDCYLKERYKYGCEERMEHRHSYNYGIVSTPWQHEFAYQLKRRGIHPQSLN